AEDLLQAGLGALGRRRDALQEALVGALLNLDEVRHRRHRLDVAEETTDPFARIEGRGHPASSIGSRAEKHPLLSRNSRPAKAARPIHCRGPLIEGDPPRWGRKSALKRGSSSSLLSPARGRGWERGLRTLSPPLLASPPSGGEEHEAPT